MSNVIELIKEEKHVVDNNTLSQLGIIHLDTDLRRDHQYNALIDILSMSDLTSVQFIDLYLEILDEMNYSYDTITKHLFDTGEISELDTHLSPHQLLDSEYIFTALLYFGGFPEFYNKLGYQIVKVGNTNTIVQDNYNIDQLRHFVYNHHFYTVTHYFDGKMIMSYPNEYIPNESTLKDFITNKLQIMTDFYLVDNDASKNQFQSIPRVEKTIKEYQFKPLNKVIHNIHLDYIESIRFISDDFSEIIINADDISFIEINNSTEFNGVFKTMFLDNLHLQIENHDNRRIDLINMITKSKVIHSTDQIIINYREGSHFSYLVNLKYKITNLSSDKELYSIHLTNDEMRFL